MGAGGKPRRSPGSHGARESPAGEDGGVGEVEGEVPEGEEKGGDSSWGVRVRGETKWGDGIPEGGRKPRDGALSGDPRGEQRKGSPRGQGEGDA